MGRDSAILVKLELEHATSMGGPLVYESLQDAAATSVSVG